MTTYMTYHSLIGPLQCVCDGEALQAIRFEDEWDSSIPTADEGAVPRALRETVAWLDAYFAGDPLPPLPPLALRGTPFQCDVWGLLEQIPLGQTTTYRDLAVTLAKRRGIERMAAQAVGGAVGRNPLPILIPCHRVVASDGALTGYRGGLDKKLALLAHEQVEIARLKW